MSIQSCRTCKFYCLPSNRSGISCAVNPGGRGYDCPDYIQIIEPQALEKVLLQRKIFEYQMYRQYALTEYGIILPQMDFNSLWLMPLSLVTRVQDLLPGAMHHERAKLYTQEQIILAFVEWAEEQILYYVVKYELGVDTIPSQVWDILEEKAKPQDDLELPHNLTEASGSHPLANG